MLKRLHKQGLQVNINECEFLVTKIKYSRIIVTMESVEIDTEKTDAVQRWKTPTSVKKVQAFLGFANFYQQFIFDFSKLS